MSTKLKIKVTKDVLEKSKWCGIAQGTKPTTNCAIAVAIRDIFPKAIVNNTEIIYKYAISPEDISIKSELPEDARVFISIFDKSSSDERVAMRELEFEIEVPDEVIDGIDIEDIKKCATLELV